MEETKGHCKHGTFLLREGCPQCIGEERAEAEVNSPENIKKRIEAVQPEENQGLVEETTYPEPLNSYEGTVAAKPLPPTLATVRVQPGRDEAVVALLNEVTRIKEYADKRVVKTPQDDIDATNDLAAISELTKAVQDKRKEYVGPLNEHVKAINDAFKLLTEPLEQANKITRDKMTAYRLELQRIQREQEEINRKRIEAAEAEMKLKGELTESVNLVEVDEAPKLTRAEMGTSGLVDNWKFRIVDLEKLPREYMVPDEAMLNSIAKKQHDKKQVPGVEFYNEPGLRVTR